ncbi:MAG TPA: hypothetical protein VGS80_24230 [Ktedonobacterales bacterium]|nr:hypothetical protein [Ktedonobacterales bacterium]
MLASDDDEVKQQLLAGSIAPKVAYEQVKATRAAKADPAQRAAWLSSD